MDGVDLEPAMNSRSTRAGREPDAIRHDDNDKRCPIVCVLTDPPSHIQPAHLLSLQLWNGLKWMKHLRSVIARLNSPCCAPLTMWTGNGG
jgi:hypothetical protein